MSSVKILDTTLREGEQTPGVDFTFDQKLEIAHLLDDFGVDYIEAGHPVVSEDIYNSVKAIGKENLNAEIVAHGRCMPSDVDLAVECDVDWIGLFFCVSDKSLEERFRMNLDNAKEVIVTAIEYAKDHGLKVRYTPEDTVRTPMSSLVQIIQLALDAGADRISIADTAGTMTLFKMLEFVKTLKNEFPKVNFNVHCHNDMGMAVANSLAAVEGGADLIDVTVNGLGERTGIASLAEVCITLHVLYDQKKRNLKMIPKLSEIVERYSGIPVALNAPVTGKNAFTHNAGLHVSAVLKDPTHYEYIPAEMVGRKRGIMLGKFSGVDNLRHHLKKDQIDRDQKYLKKLLQTIVKNNNISEMKNGDSH